MDDLTDPEEPLVQVLRTVIHKVVRRGALKTIVVLWGVHVVMVLHQDLLRTPPIFSRLCAGHEYMQPAGGDQGQ